MTIKEKQYFESLIEEVKNGKEYDSSGKFKTCCIFSDHVVLKTQHSQKFNPCTQQKNIAKLNKMGFKTPQLVYYSGGNVLKSKLITHFRTPYFEVQEKAKGRQLYLYPDFNYNNMIKCNELPSDTFREKTDKDYCNKYNLESFFTLLNCPSEHLEKYIEAFYIGEKMGILFDSYGGNLFYDKNEGFTFIDLPEISNNTMKDLNKKPVFSTYQFQKDAITTLFVSSSTPCRRILNNLILHKYIEAFDNVRDILPPKEQETSFHYFGIFLKNKTNQTFCATDFEQKMFLDVINGKDLNTILKENIELEREDFAINTIDKDFYLNCLQSFKIGDKTAFDYFNDFNITSVDTKQIENNQNNFDDDLSL